MSMIEDKLFPDQKPGDIGWTGDDGPSIVEMFADNEVMANPYPLYQRLLAERPVYDGGGVVVMTRHADVGAVLRHPQVSADDNKGAGLHEMVDTGALSEDVVPVMLRRSFLHRDPPDHTRLRGLVAESFSARRVEPLRAGIEQLVDEMLDKAAAKGSLDVIDDLAYPLPVTMIARILGVPPEDHFGDLPWARSQLCCDFEPPAVAGVVACATYSKTSQGQLEEYFDHWIKVKREEPGDDLISALVEKEQAGYLSEAEIKDTCRLMIVSGHETTISLIANGMLALIRNPDQMARLRNDPGLIGPAIEEIVRYDPPIHFTRRVALADIEINGTAIAKGQTIMAWLGAANRDPAVFVDPDRFDVTRSPNPHLGFGAGIHFCVGIALARLEAEIALSALLRRVVEPSLVQDPPQYMASTVHALEKLPIEYREILPS